MCDSAHTCTMSLSRASQHKASLSQPASCIQQSHIIEPHNAHKYMQLEGYQSITSSNRQASMTTNIPNAYWPSSWYLLNLRPSISCIFTSCHRVYREMTQDRTKTTMPAGQPRYDMAEGRPSTPAPTMAVTLWKAEYHLKWSQILLRPLRITPFLARPRQEKVSLVCFAAVECKLRC